MLQKHALEFLELLMSREEQINEFLNNGLRYLGPPEVKGLSLRPGMVIEDMCKAQQEEWYLPFL